MRTRKIVLGMLMGCLGLVPAFLWAATLKMENYTQVLVENLQIGEKYSMVKLVNLPLKVINDSDETIVITLDVIKPEESRLKDGFEAVPEVSWVGVGNSIAAVAARATYQTDVTIAIPNTKSFLGKKYQADIRARIIPQGSFVSVSLAIQGHLRFTIAPEKTWNPPKSNYADMAYFMNPERIDLVDVPVGKKIEVLTDKNQPLILTNESKKKNTFFLFSLDPQKASARLEPDTESIPDPNFLTFEKDEITLGGKQTALVRMFVEIPDKPEYRGKRYQITVSARAGESSSVARYMRVLVSTAK